MARKPKRNRKSRHKPAATGASPAGKSEPTAQPAVEKPVQAKTAASSSIDDGEPPPFWKQPRFLGAALVLLTILVYLPGFKAGYTWDDDITLTKNALVQLGEGLGYIWASKQSTDYYPITWSTFWAEWHFWEWFRGIKYGPWHLWGPNPTGYHAVNILLHALSSLLLWRLLVRFKIPGAWVAALLFAVHPMCVDSVVWISQRKNTVAMVFFFASLVAFFKSQDEKRTGIYALSIAAFAAALLSKSSVITLPAILLVLIWFRRGTLALADIKKTIPFFALAALSAFMTFWFQGKVLGHDADQGYRAFQTAWSALSSSGSGENGLLDRLLVAGHVFWFYVGKILVPTGIAMVYPKRAISPGDPMLWVLLLAMIAVFAVAWIFRAKCGRGLFAGLAYVFLALFPVLGLFSMSYHYYSWVANHLSHLAVPGVITLVVGYGAVVIPRLAKHSPQAPPIFAGLIFALFAWQTAGRAALYQTAAPAASSSRLWQDNINKYPSCTAAWNELGIAHGSQSDWESAAQAFRKSIEIDRSFSKPWNNLGTAYAHLDKTEEAIQAFEKAIEINRLEFDAHGNVGLMYFRIGEYEKALQAYDRTLELRAMSPATYHNKALVLAKMGRDDEATEAFRRAAEMNSSNPAFHGELGRHLYKLKQHREALAHLLRAIELGSSDANVHNNAAWILSTNNDPSLRDGRKAIAITDRALAAIGGNHLGLLVTRAAALAELGDFKQALATLQNILTAAQQSQNEAVVKRIQDDILRYQANQPFREG